MSEVAATPRSRAGGRTARRTLRTTPDFQMLPGLTRGIPVCEVMDGSQVERIDAASMDILENVGVLFRDPIAVDDWKRAGAKVEGRWYTSTADWCANSFRPFRRISPITRETPPTTFVSAVGIRYSSL